MAISTNHQRFPAHGCHLLDPHRLLPLSLVREVFDCPNLVDSQVLFAPTEFTSLSKQSFDDLIAWDHHWQCGVVKEDCLFLSSPRETSKLRHLRFLSLSLNSYLNAFHFPIGGFDGLLGLLDHLAHRPFMLVGKRFEERYFHHVMEPSEPCNIDRKRIVLHESAIFPLVLLDNCIVAFIQPFRSVDGFPLVVIDGAVLFNDGCWDTPCNGSIEMATLRLCVSLLVGLLSGNLVSQKLCRTALCMGDQGFLLIEFQLEVRLQKRSHLVFDRPGLSQWSHQS